MRSFLRMKNRQARKLPPEFRSQDVRYPDELVATFLQHYTKPGDVVLDPFAGYGTTLLVAEAMDRVPLGVEYDEARAAYIRSLLRRPEGIVHGDARRLASYALPPCDFSMTSPPFMEVGDDEDPLTNYVARGAEYAAYLREMAAIYAQVRDLLRPEAYAVLEVANLKRGHVVTTLAWDLARAVGEVLRFEREVVIGWDRYDYGYDHSYCLVFRRPE